jgi:hypothetical protein
MNKMESMIYESKGGMYREFVGLVTHFEPIDVSLYRKLLPEKFPMPKKPIVGIFFADYLRVSPWPMTRYQEWSVLLKTEWKGEVGWFSVTLPVTKWIPLVGGRHLGFPKYIVKDMTITIMDGGYRAVSRYSNQTQIGLTFSPGISRSLEPWEKSFIEDESFFKGNTQQLVPPGKGPRAQKIIISHVVPPKWSPQQGMIHVEVGPEEIWGGLVPDIGFFPGTYNHFVGGFNLVYELLQ